jgi:hypothetical protein
MGLSASDEVFGKKAGHKQQPYRTTPLFSQHIQLFLPQ